MRHYQSFQLAVTNNVSEICASADVFVNNPVKAVNLIEGLLDCTEVKPMHSPLRMLTAISTALEGNEGLVDSFVYTVGCTEYLYNVKVLPIGDNFKVARVLINVSLHKPMVKNDLTQGAYCA